MDKTASIKWTMINWYKFTGECNGYEIEVYKGGFCWVWNIGKKDSDDIIVTSSGKDLIYSELDCKAKASKAFNNLITKQQTP